MTIIEWSHLTDKGDNKRFNARFCPMNNTMTMAENVPKKRK